MKPRQGAAVGVGAAVCAACCAGPILAVVGAVGLGTVLGVVAFGAAGLLLALLAVPLVAYKQYVILFFFFFFYFCFCLFVCLFVFFLFFFVFFFFWGGIEHIAIDQALRPLLRRWPLHEGGNASILAAEVDPYEEDAIRNAWNCSRAKLMPALNAIANRFGSVVRAGAPGQGRK